MFLVLLLSAYLWGMKKYLLLLILFFTLNVQAQTDTVFWFAVPAITNSFGNIYRTPISFNITTYNLPALVTISQPSGNMVPKIISIPANSTQSISMDLQLDTIESKPSNMVINTGIKISSTSIISVYYDNSSIGSPELFVLKGKNALGNNFRISGQTFLENDPGYSGNYSAFAIVASEDNTIVTIVPSSDIVGHLANIPLNVTLNKGQVYVAQGISKIAGTHLQGSTVNSSKPIAITLLDDMLSGAPFGGCADMIGDQTIPANIIGTDYIATKGLLSSPYDRLYITAVSNGTIINSDGIFLTSLNAGQTYEIILSNTNTYIQTNYPVYVYQLTGQGCEVGSAILPPIVCTGNSVVSFLRSTTLDVYVSIVAKATSLNSFLVNGVSGVITNADFTVVPGTSNQYYTALKILPIANYPQNSVITISNTNALFQMGVFQGINVQGNSFGYFSNFNTFQAHATANNSNPCIGNQLQLFADTVVSATYTWTGPNGFTSIQQNPTINNYQAINAGNYILEVAIPGCSISYDTLQISTCNIDTCKTTQILLNTGADEISGALLPIGAQDMNWKVTSIQNALAQAGFSVPYNPFVITPHPVWFQPINSRWINITTSYNENGGPLNTLVEMTRHFTTIQDDTFKLKAIFTVDNYVAYFKIDGVIYYTSSAGATLTNIPTTAINDSIIFIPLGCHDITVGYVNYYNGGTGSNPTGINIEGYIQSVTGDSSILKQNCVINTPPTLNATDTLNYCANCEYISPNLSITLGLGCGNIDTVKVYFTSGYTQGQDTLQFVPQLGINSIFNASTGVLTLFGNANYGVWETVLQTVCYKSLVANISNTNAVKNVVISLGNALYNPANGNFYKLVNNGSNINWTDAKNAASSSSYFGLQGYLVTVTSAQENNFLVSLIQSLSWLGASDSAQEGIWRWVTGCEGLENNGQGRHFSNQQGNCGSVLGSGLSVNSNFVNWYNSEPNDNGCDEDYAHFLTNPLGMWNDYPNSSTLVNVPSYIVEYGCMPGDPIVNLASSITINLMLHQDTIINHTMCQGDTFLGYDSTDVYIDTFTSASGCDSLRILNLNVQSINILQNDTSICSSSAIPLNVVTTNATNTIVNFCGINYLPANLKNGLFAYYPFCGNSLDESGNGHNGTTYGAVLSTDRFGNANQSYVFNAGIASRITTNYIATGISNNFAYSAWVNPNLSQTLPPEGVDIYASNQLGLLNGGQCIIHPVHGEVFGNTAQDAGAGLYVGTNGVYVLEHSDNFVRVSLAYSATNLGWHQYTIIYDNKTPKLYIDGIWVHTGVAGSRDIFPSVGYDNNTYANYLNAGFGVGFNSTFANSTQYFDGKMDELSFWNRKLTASEISQLYNYTYTALQPVLTWSTGDTTNNITVNNTSTTTYYCTINGSGCIDSVQITINPIILDTIYNTICQGDTFLNYYTSGTWTDTFSTINGCDSLRILILTVNPLPNVNSTPAIATVCAGQSITLNGTGATSYSWSGGINNGVSFVPPSTATYTVTGTDANGCSNTNTKLVTVNALPIVNSTSTPLNGIVCAGNSVTLSGTGATSFTWSGGVNNGVSFVPASTATYTVIGTDANGCSNTNTKMITVNPLPLITINSIPNPPTICVGATVTLTANGAVNYAWSGGISNGVAFNPVSSTSYTVTGTDANNCSNTNSIAVTVNPLPNVNSTPAVATVCAGQSITLNGTGATSYSWSGGINNGVSFIPASTATYTVTGTDANGCSNTNTKLVTANALPTVNSTSIPLSGIVCTGNSVTLSGTGASTYTWNGGVNNGVSFVPASTATYTVTGTDANGCSNTNTILITVNPLPTISINSLPNPPTICIGASISLTASGANTYAWTGGISNGLAFNPVVSTTYTVTGTDANNCSNTNSIAVTANPLPNVNSTPAVATVCFGQSITLNGSGASTFSWSPSTGLNQTTGSSVIANPASTITYTVTGTDANGCSNTNTKLVTVNALPTLGVNPINPSICLNQNVNLTANGANTYSWSPGLGLNQTTGATVNAGPTVTTTYTVTGTDVNGCSNTISNTVNINALPIFTTSPSSATICQFDSTILTVSGANTYNWSPIAGLNTASGNTVKASPTASTTYTITGTNANGCTNTQTISVLVNPLPILNINPTNPTICFSESIILSVSGATTYSWSPATGLNNTTVANVVANPTSTQTYTITGTDANGCSNTISTTLTVNPLPVLSITPINPAICIGNAVNMSCNGASTYLWSPAAGLDTTVGNNVQANPTNTTTYQIIGTSNQGCKDSITNTVTVNPLPVLSVSPISTTICQGLSTTLTVSGASTYAWTPGGSLNTASGDTVIATPYLTTTYTIVGTDINACTSTKQITVNVNPSYTKYDTLELCDGMSYTFGNQTITTAGNYTYTFQTGLSCDSTVNLHVKVYDKPVSNFNLADHACVNEPVLIQNNWQSSQASYTWNVGDGILTGNTPSINVIWTIPGTKIISLEVTTQTPCIPELFVDTIEVHQAQANIIVSDADTFFCIYDQVKLQTPNINGYSYMWSPSLYFNSTTFTAEGVVKEPVTVKVYVKDQWGCEAEDSKYLNVQPCCNAYLPNSFTPNGDGLNDVFRIIGEGNYRILDFYVANRWGNIVFRTIDQNVGWDGKIQGIEQSMDTYYYFLKYECSNGEKRFIKGDLTLLK
jgi:gliding motility-associated-like protein